MGKPRTPYVVEDPEIIAKLKEDILTKRSHRTHDVVQMLKDNPGKPVAVPKGYIHPTAFSNYNKMAEDHHVILRGWSQVQRGEDDVYYALLREGKSNHGNRLKAQKRAQQKKKRLEQAKGKRPEEFPEPELVNETQ